jgi:hypothetical protein
VDRRIVIEAQHFGKGSIAMQKQSKDRQSSGMRGRPLHAAAYLRRTVRLAFTVPATLANPWSGFHRTNIARSR